MFASKRAARRFNLLLLDEGEAYVEDYVAHCTWPREVPGNWGGAARLPGQLRLCTKSLFFEPDDVRVPIVRYVGIGSLRVSWHTLSCVHCPAEACQVT